MKWIDSLKRWRSDRNMITPSGAIISMLEEELTEYSDARDVSDEAEMVDAMADIIVLASNELALMGYDLDLVMKQCVKHISSRVQDPTQAEEWRMSSPSGKWLKDKSQDPSTIYQPDYTVCRLKRT